MSEQYKTSAEEGLLSHNDGVSISPEVIQRALLKDRLKNLEGEFKKAIRLRDEAMNAAKQYDLLGIRLEGAMAVLREMLAAPPETGAAENSAD